DLSLTWKDWRASLEPIPMQPVAARRLGAIDWLLLGTFLPIVLFGVVMSVVHGVRGDFVMLPFWVSAARDQHSYPVVRRILPPWTTQASPLAAGDHLLQVDGHDLRGLSGLGCLVRFYAAARTGACSLSFTKERSGVRSEVLVPFFAGFPWPVTPWWIKLPFVIGMCGTAILLLVRATHWHLARRAYLSFMLSAIMT